MVVDVAPSDLFNLLQVKQGVLWLQRLQSSPLS